MLCVALETRKVHLLEVIQTAFAFGYAIDRTFCCSDLALPKLALVDPNQASGRAIAANLATEFGVASYWIADGGPMSDYCYSPRAMRHIVSQAEMMDRMLETVGVDPKVAARIDSGMAWYEARTRCLECASVEQCRAWLLRAPAGYPHVPDFCPNRSFFRECNPAGN